MFAPEDASEDCEFTNSTVADGVIDVSGSCQAPNGEGSATMAISGTYTPTTMAADLSVNVEGGPMAMSMSGTMTAERTGDCEVEAEG